MRQRLFGLLVWVILLFIVGTGGLLMAVLRAVVWLRFRSLLILGGVYAIAQSPDTPTVQHLINGFRPIGYMILFVGVVVLAAAIVYHGVRSSVSKRLWRRFRFHE